MRLKVVYIAGPYRGKSGWVVAQNIRRAEVVGYRVAEIGCMPLIPHANTAHFDGEFSDLFWLEGTMELLRRSDAVVMCMGWEASSGSVAEKKEAESLGIPVFLQVNDASFLNNLDDSMTLSAWAADR